MHHIISDAWSLGVLIRELVVAYEYALNDRPSPLPELPIQYADFALWQRRWLQGEALEKQLDYWRAHLGGNLPVLELPTDRPRPAVLSPRGARQMFVLPLELSERLRELSRSEGATLYMTLLTAFQTLLHRYTGQEEFVVGTTIANRNRHEVEGLIGFFVNTLVLRADMRGEPSFRELLVRVRETCLGAYAHQDVPFEQLVEILLPERSGSGVPLFRVMFGLQNAPTAVLELQGVTLSPIEIEEKTSAFDLTLNLIDTGKGAIGGAMRYSTDLFDASTVGRMFGHFETLLGSIIADAGARVGALEMLTEEERERQEQAKSERRESKLRKLKGIKPKSVSLTQESLVETRPAEGGRTLPLIVRPRVGGVDLAAWAAANRGFVAGELHRHGALLFRDFDVHSVHAFEQFAKAISPELMQYGERSSPRTRISGDVYTSTTHPADQCIVLHNEQSYTHNWPMKLWFYCAVPATKGGATPVADSRRVLARLSPETVEKFERRQVTYVRNYGDGLGLPWEEVFQTREHSAVEEHCRREGIEFEWKEHGRLRTRQVRPAIRSHPKTGERVWFNHANFFHFSTLDEATRSTILSVVGEEDVPFNTFYGDGGPIEPEVLEEIREAYRQELVAFEWRQGDILMVDNMLAAHGREPYEGPRQVAVAMAEPFDRDETQTV
jgi:alpha-ketoglutarate-dependent taurine dioxygenase